MSNFIHLRVCSDYSLGKGAIRIKDLVKHCVVHDIPAIALTDHNNLFASLEFSLEAQKNGVQPIIGIDIPVVFGIKELGSLLLLAKDDIGYSNILKLSSAAYLQSENNRAVSLEELNKYSQGLICLTSGEQSFEKSLFKQNRQDEIKEHISRLSEIFKTDLYIELYRCAGYNGEYESALLDIAYDLNIPLVATNYAAYLRQDMHKAHDALMCIASGRYVVEEARPKSDSQGYLKSTKEMEELFSDLPEALKNTIIIAKKCVSYPKAKDPLLPTFNKDETLSEADIIRDESIAGLKKRLKKIDYEINEQEYYERLDYELSVINKMQYPGYFLIVSDFIRWSKDNGIPVGPGRGSGAGSVVAWSLQITDLDPIKYGLLFERFLNPDRVSMPDFDIDFCQDRREEVIKYVQNKYGEDKVAQIITFGKLQARAVLRDVGRVLQMPYGVIDKICKMVPNNPANPVTLAQAIALDKDLMRQRKEDPEINKLLSISLQLEGLNRHASTHAAGIVIADRPIVELSPLYKDQPTSMQAVQYSMKYAELAGLIKFDFLGLRTLTAIDWTCKLIRRSKPDFNVNDVSLEDEKTYSLLSKGETIGVFQFESAGMKEAIKKLKPDAIGDLIALGSLYRPGPMDNIPSYINRKHGLEQPEYLHPLMEPILKETYGIIVYQEQVMEIAKQLAGYTLGNADLLRRAMGKKIKAEMEAQREGFVSGCLKNGIDKPKAEEIFALIEKFASYGFNKSHAAAYAIISYQTAYLKANYTLEFLVAFLNLDIQDTDKINLFLEEAKHKKIAILPPDLNKSEGNFNIENGAIRFGLCGLKNVGTKAVEEIVKIRKESGEFKDIFDFFERVENQFLNKRMIETFAKSGAFDSVYENRHELLINAELLIRFSAKRFEEKDCKQIGLFADVADEVEISKPVLNNVAMWSHQKKLSAEFEAFGFYLSSHPLEVYESKLEKIRCIKSNLIEGHASAKGAKMSIAGVITSRKIRSSAKGKYAFVQLSDISGLIEVSIFNEKILFDNEAILLPGNAVFMRIDARKDDSGLRLTVESILPIEEALSHISNSYTAIVKDPTVIPLFKNYLSDKGSKIEIGLIVEDGNTVFFSSDKQLYINDDNLEELKKVSGLELIEK